MDVILFIIIMCLEVPWPEPNLAADKIIYSNKAYKLSGLLMLSTGMKKKRKKNHKIKTMCLINLIIIILILCYHGCLRSLCNAHRHIKFICLWISNNNERIFTQHVGPKSRTPKMFIKL